MLKLPIQLDDVGNAIVKQILGLLAEINIRTKDMATAFDVIKDEMEQTRAKVDALAVGLADIRAQLANAISSGLTADQVAALVQLADDTQAAADAALAGGSPEEPPAPPPAS